MAETFEAARLGAGGFEQRVCLKRVLPAFGQNAEFVSRFRREAKLAARLRHTNIVGVIDAGEIDGSHYMALELVDGVDLRSLLRSSSNQRLPADTVVIIALDLAFALEHAHGTLVHRDVSPSNILLSRSGDSKLADFGVAKALDGNDVTASRIAQGKMPYMAPEHIQGEAIDGRADLFSLGVVMFEAIAGARPFDGAHDVETMQRILSGRRASLPSGIPADLARIIERLLALDRNARFQTASELLDALAELAPPPAVRRSLASLIESHRGGPSARLHVRAREEERDTELTRLPEVTAGLAARPSPKPSRRPTALILGALLLTGLVVTVAATQGGTKRAGGGGVPGTVPDPEVEPGPDPVPDPERLPEPGPVPETRPVPEPALEVDTGTEGRVVRRWGRGWISVVVQPWGNVWIDGTYMGRAPLRARLPKGRHVVEVGRELPAQKRVVRVQPGARKEIAFTLAE